MISIIVTGRGCRTRYGSSHQFRCSMCRPYQAHYDPVVRDNAVQCANCRIEKGIIYYYHEPVRDKKGKIIEWKLVEKYRDENT